MGDQRWSPGESLWRLIETHVPDPEVAEVRAVLGESLVDMYTLLHSEVDTWLGILQEVKQGANCSNRPETPGFPLADPPVVKELLRGEVRMLLQSVRERACKEGRDGEEVWLRYDPDIVNYALGRSTDNSGCVPGSSQHPQQGSRPDLVPSVGDVVEALRDQLNMVHIYGVVAYLRCVLTEHCEALMRQVLWLQEDIEQELRSQRQVKDTEPTVTELREQRRMIQMDLDLPSPLLPHRPLSSSSSSSASFSPPTVQRFENTSRSSAGLRTPHPRTGTPDLGPHPPDLRLRPLPSLSHVKPSPPPGAPPARPSALSMRPLQGSSLARTGDLQPDGLLPRPSEAALRPAVSSNQRSTRKQVVPSILSVDQRNNANGVENNVSSVSDNENPHGDQHGSK